MTVAALSPPTNQVEHFDRCYRALGAKFGANVDKRTRAALDQYRRENPGDELELIAAEKFPEAEFVTVRDVPIFSEHTTTDSRGRKTKYGKAELAGIVQRCNERILDTGDFAPLSDGHTPTQEMIASGAKMPDVLGYCGPFRIGVIGRRKPRYAIFADEHYHKSDVEKVRRLPRRSPEVWLEDRLEDRILDPIAALGAETPRLDLGMARFRRAGDDREVERYSAVAAFPSGVNTFISDTDSQKHRYGADNGEQSMGGQPVNASVQDIVAALQATKTWAGMQTVVDMLPQLQQLVGGGGGGAGDHQEPDGDESFAGDPGMPPGDSSLPGDDGMPSAGPFLSPPPPVPATPSQTPAMPANLPASPSPSPAVPGETADMDDDEKQRYAALCPNGKAGYMAARKRWKPAAASAPASPSREAYSKLAAERDAVAAQAKDAADRQSALEKQVAELERKNRDTERYSRLAELSRVHVFDLDEEFSVVADLDDDAWERQVRAIGRYARRNDPTAVDYLPMEPPKAPPRKDNPEQLKARYSRAGEIANERQRRGQRITAEEALAEAIKEENGQ